MCCVIVFVQVASSEWFLVVQMQDFLNLYDAEIRNSYYCCCDDHDNQCAGADINAVNNDECFQDNHYCQPYYVLHVNFQGCPSTYTMCPVPEPTDSSAEHKSITTSILSQLNITFSQSELKMYNKVRTSDI